MDYNEKTQKKHLKEIHPIAKSLGLKGKDGIYTSGNGFVIDLTATKADKMCVLATIGMQTINYPN